MSTPAYRSQTLTPQSQHLMTTPRSVRNNYSSFGFSSPGQLPSGSSQVDGSSSGAGMNAGSSRATVNPFISNLHGHPSFNPVKLGTKGSGDSKTPKQPKAPDKPLMPYMRYSRKVSRLVWDSVKASNPDLKLWEIGKIIGQMWRELSDDEKQEYLDEYETEKIQYTEAMKTYHNSPAYQSWLSAKGKVDMDVESEEPEKTRRSKATAASSASHAAESRVVTIQQADDDDDAEDGYSIKHVAAARFQRNHCLINEIFSDAIVPDVRTIINESRMMVLKRQVNSLTMHQKKLENELEQIEQKHASKKCKFSESSEQFYEDLAKLCEEKPQITDEQFQQMVTKSKKELAEKQKQMMIEQQLKNEKNKKENDQSKMAAEDTAAEQQLSATSMETSEQAGEVAVQGTNGFPPEQNVNSDVLLMDGRKENVATSANTTDKETAESIAKEQVVGDGNSDIVVATDATVTLRTSQQEAKESNCTEMSVDNDETVKAVTVPVTKKVKTPPKAKPMISSSAVETDSETEMDVDEAQVPDVKNVEQPTKSADQEPMNVSGASVVVAPTTATDEITPSITPISEMMPADETINLQDKPAVINTLATSDAPISGEVSSIEIPSVSDPEPAASDSEPVKNEVSEQAAIIKNVALEILPLVETASIADAVVAKEISYHIEPATVVEAAEGSNSVLAADATQPVATEGSVPLKSDPAIFPANSVDVQSIPLPCEPQATNAIIIPCPMEAVGPAVADETAVSAGVFSDVTEDSDDATVECSKTGKLREAAQASSATSEVDDVTTGTDSGEQTTVETDSESATPGN